MMRALLAMLLALFVPIVAHGHESRPAYLELRESAPGRFDVLWRTPVLAGVRLPVALQMPAGVRNLREPTVEELSDSLLERRTVDAGPDGLAGRRIGLPGLQLTITDVLARIELLDGRAWTIVARPAQPWIEIARARGRAATAFTFFTQGIEHILLGVDHLLFVFGLLLIVRTPWMLVKTITAFTVAHSITLAIATLGYATVPAPPLNAAIALSILFLGPEILRAWRGGTSLTIRHPWVVAFAFGLLHGFGFASGLAAIGLPRNDIPLALLVFNAGVEAGQLAFVALIVLVHRAFKSIDMRWSRAVELAPAYAVGSLGAFWTIQRVVMVVMENA